VVELVGLRLLHRLDDVVVLDLADAHEGGQQGNGDGHELIELAEPKDASSASPLATSRGSISMDGPFVKKG
jgi:hypothetical protein